MFLRKLQYLVRSAMLFPRKRLQIAQIVDLQMVQKSTENIT